LKEWLRRREGNRTGMIERGESRPKMEDREIRGWETGGGENGAIIHTVR